MSIQTKSKSKFKPSDVDLSDGLKSTYGIVEYEKLAIKIIEWLAENDDAWDAWFRIDEHPFYPGKHVKGVDPILFAMFAASGWVYNQWFPKYAFVVHPEFVKILKKRSKYKTHTGWYNRKR